MTTPAHCTRTDPHKTHAVWRDITDHAPIGQCPGYPWPPAHCTITDVHLPHTIGTTRCPGVYPPRPDALPAPPPPASGARPGVEPPADVQATPDPRLDVVADRVRESWIGGYSLGDTNKAAYYAQRILDALDAMRPDEPRWPARDDGRWPRTATTAELANPAGHDAGQHAQCDPVVCPERYQQVKTTADRLNRELYPEAFAAMQAPPAPAGLSAAQEIESAAKQIMDGLAAIALAQIKPYADAMRHVTEALAAAEHGPDETPDPLEGIRVAREVAMDVMAERDEAEARADLAEARLADLTRMFRLARTRLAQVSDALVDNGELDGLRDAINDALAWTPDDTAPATEDEHECMAPNAIHAALQRALVELDRVSTELDVAKARLDVPPMAGDTATAGAATGDGDE